MILDDNAVALESRSELRARVLEVFARPLEAVAAEEYDRERWAQQNIAAMGAMGHVDDPHLARPVSR